MVAPNKSMLEQLAALKVGLTQDLSNKVQDVENGVANILQQYAKVESDPDLQTQQDQEKLNQRDSSLRSLLLDAMKSLNPQEEAQVAARSGSQKITSVEKEPVAKTFERFMQSVASKVSGVEQEKGPGSSLPNPFKTTPSPFKE